MRERILVAPDKFKGSLSAVEVAEAMVEGARRARPEAVVDTRPLADGGDGTIDALIAGVGGRVERRAVTDPLGRPIDAPLGLLDDGRAVVEMAGASGLSLLADDERDPLATTSRGLGELVAAALELSPRAVIVGVGGSASTDGAAGAATALGWRFLDSRGRALPPGGGSLRHLRHIEPPSEARRDIEVVGALDVDSPLLGASGAAKVYGPQKGASPEEVAVLEEGLAVLAQCLRTELGVEVEALVGGGAGGGAGAGLFAFLGARLVGGFELVASAGRLRDVLGRASLVITGEGRLDDQTLRGKAPAGIAGMAAAAGVPCMAVAGRVELSARGLERAGFAAVASLEDELGATRARADPAAAVAEVTERLLGRSPRSGLAR